MKFNKDKNSYTFIFSIVLVIIVGVVLASLSIGLDPLKKANVEVKKKMNILSAMGVESNRNNGTELYEKYIKDSYVISSQGELLEDLPEDKQAFNLDVLKQYRDKTVSLEDRLYPIFEAVTDEGETIFILPTAGKGLWGPVWGYVAIADDYETIAGVAFDHEGETPGLGAEIGQDFFTRRYKGEKISIDGVAAPIIVVKDGSGTQPQRVDGITGGTVTSKGVEQMVNETMKVYVKYFNNLR